MARLFLQFWEVHNNVDPVIKPKKKPTIKNQAETAKKDVRKKSKITLVAEEEEVIGFIQVDIKNNDDFFRMKKFAMLSACVVDINHRKKGVAKQLTEEAVKEVKKRNVKYMKTECYNVNKDAMRAWEKLGFQKISTNLLRKL